MVESLRTVLTAADHRYFRSLCQLLLSAERRRVASGFQWIACDLGLRPAERQLLGRRFPWCAVERFDFAAEPAHVARLVNCAWKPIVIARHLVSDGGPVLWLDSATIVRTTLDPPFARIERLGVFSLVGQSPLVAWCHPATLAFMQVPVEDRGKPCRFGGALGFDGRRAPVRALVERWRDLARDAACIDPPGASRGNHRFDQAVLTNLLYQWEREHGLALGPDEEVDISSTRPVPWISTRNKVAPWVPIGLDPLARGYHAAYKALDRLVLRMRAGADKTLAPDPRGGA